MRICASLIHFNTFCHFFDVTLLWYITINHTATLPVKDGNFPWHKRASKMLPNTGKTP